MFLPSTRSELDALGWAALDVILVSGDSYIDHPASGAAVIGRVLEKAGYRVGIIAQPDIHSEKDIARLGAPRLFWGVTGGCVDSMVANYTATQKKRRQDDYTPGGENNRRPDRAVIAYANLIRRYFKTPGPIVLGGIEASLRRVAHYDYWDDRIRRAILFDAKADYLLYGMAEKSVLALAQALRAGQPDLEIRGLCYLAKTPPPEAVDLPSYEEVIADKLAFIRMFHLFYQNNDALTARTLCQRHGDRYLVQNPPEAPLKQAELDEIYDLPFERRVHPFDAQGGAVRALETIRFSISTHRGCYGECNFCAIAVHEGRTVQWRSQESVVAEATRVTQLPGFKGYLSDVGGPTANMYGYECEKKLGLGSCANRRCLTPEICRLMRPDHRKQIQLLERLRQIPGIKKVFVASGIRYDLVLADRMHGRAYLRAVVNHHVSGQMKIAPEHSENNVLRHMGKPGNDSLLRFKAMFETLTAEAGLPQFLTYYLIAAHPGCTEADMRRMKDFVSSKLHITPEQVQVFTPTPSTYASLMYYTELDPFTLQPIFVEKNLHAKELQKEIITEKGAQAPQPGQPPRAKPPQRGSSPRCDTSPQSGQPPQPGKPPQSRRRPS